MLEFPLTSVAFVQFAKAHKEANTLSNPLRDFAESYGISAPDEAYQYGYRMIPYWQQVEAKLAALENSAK